MFGYVEKYDRGHWDENIMFMYNGEKKYGQSGGIYQMDFFTLTPLFEPPR